MTFKELKTEIKKIRKLLYIESDRLADSSPLYWSIVDLEIRLRYKHNLKNVEKEPLYTKYITKK